jgi:hypothetical protein
MMKPGMPGPRRENDRSLLRRWIVVGLVAGPLVIAIGIQIGAGRGGDARGWIFLAALAAIVPLLVIAKRGAERALRRGLQSADPTTLIDWYARVARRTPTLRADLEVAAATAAALYERFDLAGARLAAVDWELHPPHARAGAALARALICHGRGDHREALRLARIARALADVDPRFPGAATSARAVAVHVAIAEVFAGVASAQTAAALGEGRARLPLLGQLLAAWGLCALAAAPGDAAAQAPAADEVTALEAFIAAQAPHCGLLRRRPGAS